MSEVTEKRIERTVVWLDAGLVPRMDGWLKADNCKNHSEFINKALRFYMGYLGTEDNTAYLSKAILTAIQGTLDDNNNRLCRIIFKWAVELNMMCHTIAAHFRTDPIHTRELRAYAVDEVKRTNGQVSFESAVHQSIRASTPFCSSRSRNASKMRRWRSSDRLLVVELSQNSR